MSQITPVKPVLSWPGGKRRLAKHLLPLIPPHTLYCEPFAGGLALMLAKERSPAEVVNDLNGDLVALYRCAQYHLDALIAEIRFSLNSRRNLKDFLSQPGLTDIQRAARFLIRNRTSFAGMGTNYGVARMPGSGGYVSRESMVTALAALSARLDRVSVENLTWRRCVELYDGPETFFFCDPPYLNAPTKAYDGFTEAQMTELAEALSRVRGRWLLTVDDSPFNRRLFAGHTISEHRTQNRLTKVSARAVLAELIITPRAACVPR